MSRKGSARWPRKAISRASSVGDKSHRGWTSLPIRGRFYRASAPLARAFHSTARAPILIPPTKENAPKSLLSIWGVAVRLATFKTTAQRLRGAGPLPREDTTGGKYPVQPLPRCPSSSSDKFAMFEMAGIERGRSDCRRAQPKQSLATAISRLADCSLFVLSKHPPLPR